MSRSLEFRVGLVTLAAVALFIWMIVFVSGHNPLEETYFLNITFSDVGLLQVGDLVRLNGISIGKVEKVGIKDDKVVVGISVAGRIKIRKDAKIVVGDVGLFGTNYIKISQYRTTRDPDYWQPNDFIQGSEEPGFEELLAEGQELMVQAKSTFMSLNLIMGDEDFHRNFEGVFANLNDATASTKRLFDRLDTRSQEILSDVGDLTASLEKNVDAVGGKAVVAVERLDAVMEQLEGLARENRTNVGRAVAALTRMVEQLEAQGQTAEDLKGTLGNVRDLTGSLKGLAEDLRAGGATAENIRSITSQAERVVGNLENITGSVKEFVLDPDTKRDIKQAFQDVNSLATNIDRTTSAVGELKFRLQAAVYYGGADDDYRSDFVAGFTMKDRYMLRIGFEDVGRGDGMNVLQVGARLGGLWVRTGLFSDEMGLGLDLPPLLHDRFRLSLEAYNPDDLVWRGVGSVRVAGNTRVAVWHERRPGEDVTYGGVQQEF